MYFTMDTWAPGPLQKHLGVVSMFCFFYRGAFPWERINISGYDLGI
jgi:hypothetical protein